MSPDATQVTQLLNLAAEGDSQATARVFELLYDELRRIASAHRARLGAGETMRTTAVVHEAYMRLSDRRRMSFDGRQHFFRTAARSMRDALVDEARRKASQKRGGDWRRVELNDIAHTKGATPEDLLTLDAALIKLEADHPEDHQLVMLRYFAGLTLPEAAEVLGTSLRTAERRWRFCRAWLADALTA